MTASIRLARRIVSGLALPEPVTRFEPLRKGLEPDRKYLLWAGDQARWLLRICPSSEAPRRKQSFDILSCLHAHGVPCPEPVHLSDLDDGSCCVVTSFIPGECVEDALPGLAEKDQFALGLQAGRELAALQSALEFEGSLDWPGMRRAHYYERRATCREQGLVFDRQGLSERFVEEHLPLLSGRPIRFLHGDYHPGNMICRGSRLAGVIDFDLCRWGDPLFEFYKVGLLTVPISPAFARGQVNGYFGGEPPHEFWPLYNLYMAMILPADLVWTSRNYPKFLKRSARWLDHVVDTHDFVNGGPPAWYTAP